MEIEDLCGKRDYVQYREVVIIHIRRKRTVRVAERMREGENPGEKLVIKSRAKVNGHIFPVNLGKLCPTPNGTPPSTTTGWRV